MPMDEVLTEELASQQQTLAVAEGLLRDMTITCKQCKVTFVFTRTVLSRVKKDATSVMPGTQEMDS